MDLPEAINLLKEQLDVLQSVPESIIDPGGHESVYRFSFENQLPEVEATLTAIIEELETFGAPEPGDGEDEDVRRASVFIAHGGDSEALNQLVDFLDEIGIKPLVVERLPSEGRSVNENVQHYMGKADCAIVLASGDDLVDGRLQSRPNVYIELGRFQERFPNRVIYLLERGATLPSNVSEKVWERYSDDDMGKAFLKVVRELRAYGLPGRPR